MKSTHLAVATVAAFLTLAACSENPLAPTSNLSSPATASFTRPTARPYTFTTVDVPGAFQTFPSGINADGVIVGWYQSGGGCPSAPCVTRGFFYDGTTFTTVVYHNATTGTDAAVTQLRGIGPGGEMVGSYRMTGEPAVNAHGFIRTPTGGFTPVDYPNHTNTIAQRILPDGTILGCYHDTDQMGTMHGIKVAKGDFSSIDMATTMNNGGTPSGNKVTGFFTDMSGKARAYVIEDGDFTPFDAPNSSGTQAWDMNPGGAIVGVFADEAAPNAQHGFVRQQGTFSTINYPNSAYTDIFGINAAGDIVGKYRLTATGPLHGYVATRRGD